MTTIRKFPNVTDQVVKTPQDVTYIVDNGGTATSDVQITLAEQVEGTYIGTNVTLTFIDGAGGDDSLLRNRGSWADDGFGVGMTLTVANTTSNNGSVYVITGITSTTFTGDTLVFATATITAEVITSDTVTIDGAIPDTDWIIYEQIGGGLNKFAFIEAAGTGLRFVKTGGAGTVRVWVKG